MDFHLLADVRQSDGGKLGELRHVVYRPDSGEVRSIVVQPTSGESGAVLVPISAVDTADDDAVYVRLSEDEFRALEPYAVGMNIAPPPAEYDPTNPSADLHEEPVDVPNVPPVGAAEGITSIAFTPIMDVQRNIGEGEVVVGDRTMVRATDAELGHVEHVLVSDDTRRVTDFLVEKGVLFPQTVQVTVDWVEGVLSNTIVLGVDRATVQAAQQT